MVVLATLTLLLAQLSLLDVLLPLLPQGLLKKCQLNRRRISDKHSLVTSDAGSGQLYRAPGGCLLDWQVAGSQLLWWTAAWAETHPAMPKSILGGVHVVTGPAGITTPMSMAYGQVAAAIAPITSHPPNPDDVAVWLLLL